MVHLSDEALGAIRANAPISRRAYAHVDGCVACRRALAAAGASLPARAGGGFPLRAALIAMAALIICAVAIAPVRALALGFVEIFEPRAIAFVPMTEADFADMRDVPDFSDLGDATQITQERRTETSDPRQVAAIAGYRPLAPQLANASAALGYTIIQPGIAQLTFNEAKAQAWAASKGIALKAMPSGMDGAIVRVAFAPIVIAGYSRDGARTGGTTWVARSATRGRRVPLRASHGWNMNDTAIVAQMPVPKVGSTGVSVRTIEDYLLSQPGVPPKLAAAFASLRDPATTLPIPVPVDRASMTPVFVDGVWGMELGDNTGLGAVVLWQRDGFIYGVAGAGTLDENVAIANSLR
jgi:hypothetical protein